jgi:hypothetical protein
MLATETTAANVVSLEVYRRRPRPWPDKPRPGPIGGRKAKEEAVLAEIVFADGRGATRTAVA